MRKIKRILDIKKLNSIIDTLRKIYKKCDVPSLRMEENFFYNSVGFYKPEGSMEENKSNVILTVLSLLMYKRISDSFSYYEGNFRLIIREGCLWSDIKADEKGNLMEKISNNLEKIYDENNLFGFYKRKPIVRALRNFQYFDILEPKIQSEIYDLLNELNLSPSNISDVELIYILEKFNTCTFLINELNALKNEGRYFEEKIYFEDRMGINGDNTFFTYYIDKEDLFFAIYEKLNIKPKNISIYFHNFGGVWTFDDVNDIEFFLVSPYVLYMTLLTLNHENIESTPNALITVGGDRIHDETIIFSLMLPLKIQSMWYFSLSNETELLPESEAIKYINSENNQEREKAIKSLAIGEIKNFEIRTVYNMYAPCIENIHDLEKLKLFKNSFIKPTDSADIIIPYPVLMINAEFLISKIFKSWLFSFIQENRIEGLSIYQLSKYQFSEAYLVLGTNIEKKLRLSVEDKIFFKQYFILPWFFGSTYKYKIRKNPFKFIFRENIILVPEQEKLLKRAQNSIQIDFFNRIENSECSVDVPLHEMIKSGFNLSPFKYKILPELLKKNMAIKIEDVCKLITPGLSIKKNDKNDTCYIVTERILSNYLNSIYLDLTKLPKTNNGVFIEDECIALSLKTLTHGILKPDREIIGLKPGKNVVFMIPDKTKINIKYLYYILQTHCVLEQLDGFYPDKNPDDPVELEILKNAIIPLPSLDEQLVYVRYLDELVDSIMRLPEKLSRKDESSESADEFKLTGFIAHELKNKLPFVNETIELIKDYLSDKNLLTERPFKNKDNSFEYYIEKSKKFLTHVNDVVTTVRDLLSEDFKQDDFEKTNICDFIKKIVEDHCQIENIKVKFKNRTPVYAKIHKRALEHALANLIKNAETHGFPPETEYRKNPLLIFDVKVSDDTIIIDYMNNGVPLKKEIDTDVFLTPGKKTSESKGYGIGGAIIKKMIKEVHKGEVKLIHDKYPFHLQITIPKMT